MAKSSFEEILNKEGYLIYPFKGISMLPLLVEGEDVIRIEQAKESGIHDRLEPIMIKKENC